MTLSLQRPDDRGGLGSMEKWSNSGWGNQHAILEPAMNPLYGFQSQSMFPQLMEQQALVQAFVQQANADQSLLDPPQGNNNNLNNNNNNSNSNSSSLDTLLNNSSRSPSMVDSTSDDDCMAPENLQINCIAALGGGPMSPVLQANNMLDRTASTGTSLMNAKDFFRLESSPGGLLSPNALPRGESDDSGSGSGSGFIANLKRRLEEDDEWMEGIHRPKMQLKAQDAFPFADPALTAMPPPPPFLAEASGAVPDMDKLASMRAILFRHASQPVPSLEEIASTRPKRRNVRISKDPQSVAARLRRERISDRIRVLQRLVPGGTKMDTASMLDEAIHYVKFLKLQLQTLEQIGNNNTTTAATNNCDPRGFVQQQPSSSQLASLVRPFDLNCAQAWPAPPTSMVNTLNHHTAAPLQQGALSVSWSSEANHAFSDAMQEQFCH